MMIRANGEYLDFNGDIEIESQIKLFEEISTSNGDFSYDISIQDNGFNRKILGIPRADTIKTIYQVVPSEIIDDTGQSIYMGKLQVNRIEGGFISSTFYAGNTEWFAMLSDPMTALPLYRYDVDLTEANIQASWLNSSGIVFPLLDAGGLITRSYANMKVEDFVSAFYVKTLFNEIFNPQGIKLEGDLLSDPIFNKLTISSNGKSQGDVDARSSYVNKTTAQAGLSALTKVTFQDESIFPFFDGSIGNFASSTYTADVKMRIKVELNLLLEVAALTVLTAHIYKNGASYKSFFVAGFSGSETLSKIVDIPLEAGDYVEVYTDISTGSYDVKINSTIKITPVYIYKVFGNSSVPNWTQGEFVSNILRNFNVLPSYNTASGTLTLDLFNKIKDKEPVDISDEITVETVDFSEFVSSYARNNIFKYQGSNDEDLKRYNISNFISYGSGNLTIDNAYIENSADVVESDFTSPITYMNGIFDMSAERFNFVSLEEIETVAVTSVSNASDIPRFNITNASNTYSVGDLVRLETTADSYNGDWVINTVTSSYIVVNGLAYDVNATGDATLLRHEFTTDENVYLFINVPSASVSFFSSKTSMLLDDATTFSTAAIAYFNLLNNNTPINRVYKQSLSFGAPNNMLNYQITMLDTYWSLFSRMLNSPVMLIGSGNLKRVTFDKIKSFLRPVRVNTEETTNLYYLNRNRGYKGSERPCELQLIKLN